MKEVKFLGHCISKTGVTADPERIKAILNYPTLKNCKQHRQLLGTCSVHSRFVNYADYTAPLLKLLKKEQKLED
jgi:hypothetical protein